MIYNYYQIILQLLIQSITILQQLESSRIGLEENCTKIHSFGPRQTVRNPIKSIIFCIGSKFSKFNN